MRAQPPVDAAVDPIRHEAIAGRPMIVLTGGGLVGRVREALAVAGRLDALRIVHGKEPLPEHLDYGPWSRRPCREARATPPHLVPLEDLDLAEALDGRHAIVVLGAPGSAAQAYAVALHDRAVAAASVSGRPGPLLIFDKPDDNRMPECARPGTGFALRVVADDAWPIAVQGDRHLIADAVDRAWMRAGAWRERLAAFEGRHAIERHGRHHVIADGRRTVVAAMRHVGVMETRWLGRTGATSEVEVHEIGEGGACRGVRLTRAVASVADVEALARLAWRGGISRLSLGNPDVVASARSWQRNGGERLMESLVGDGGAVPLLARVAPLLDTELERVLAHVPHAPAVERLLRADPDRASRRRDFATTWPALAALLLDPGALAAVDAGARTTPIVARALGVPEAIARRLVGVRQLHLDEATLPRIRKVPLDAYGRMLAAFGHDRLPRAGDEGGWDAFHRLVGLAVGAFGRAPAFPEAEVARLVGRIPGATWNERLDAVIDPAKGWSGLPEIQDLLRGLAEWLGQLTDREMPRGVAVAMLARHGSLQAIVRACDAWHAMPAMRTPRRGLPPYCRWPVPFDPVDLGDGWSATALSSMADLSDEGLAGLDGTGVAGLDHCVGGYGPECQTGRSLVLSLRRRTAGGVVRVSTAELVPSPGAWWVAGKPFHLRQHRGPRNRDPGPEAQARLDRLRDMLRDGDVPTREGATEPRGAVALVHDRAAAETALPGWRRVLPAPYARLTADGIARAAVALADGVGAYP